MIMHFTRDHARSCNSVHLGVAKRGPVLRQALKLMEWSGIRVGHGSEVLPERLIEATTSIIYLCLLVTYAYIIPGIIM